MAPEQAPDGSIVITPREFYDGVKSDISEIKLAVAPLTDMARTVDKHSERLDKLERLAWVALGVAMASGGSVLFPILNR